MRDVVDGGAAQRRGRVIVQLLAGRSVDGAGHGEHGGESEEEAHEESGRQKHALEHYARNA